MKTDLEESYTNEATSKIDNCLKICSEIEEMGTNSLIQLNEQGKIIKHTSDTCDEIQDELKYSDWILKGMGSFLGWRNWFSSRTPRNYTKHTAKYTAKDTEHTAKNIANDTTILQKQILMDSSHSKEKYDIDSVFDDKLDKLGNAVGILKEISLEMNSELKNLKERACVTTFNAKNLKFVVALI